MNPAHSPPSTDAGVTITTADGKVVWCEMSAEALPGTL